jgi:Bacterial protein of unknown function (DUF885)
VGVHSHDGRLPDLSAPGLGAALAEADSLRVRLGDLPDEPLSEAEGIDRTLAEGFLEIQRWELVSDHFARANPSVHTGEAAFGLISLLRRPFAPLETRLEAAAHRLEALPALLDSGYASASRAPVAWVERAENECAGLLALLGPGLDQILATPVAGSRAVRAAADRAAGAVARFLVHLRRARSGSTASHACGPEALDLLLRRGHCLSIDADEIERYALDQLAESEGYLRAHAAGFGAGSWPDVLEQLAERHPPAEGYYARFDEIWGACRRAAADHRLLTWPDSPVRFEPRPAWARAAAPHLYFLAYHSPAPFDDLPEVEHFVPPIEPEMPPAERARLLRATNDSVIKLNHVVHHGGIGHHVQNWHAFRAPSRIGRIAAVDCASRIALLCGGTMAEGWACYATELMDEVGFLTPLEGFAVRHGRLRMAARAVADVRLHRGAWTLGEVADLYRDRVGMTAEAARAEAVKNSLFPGTALAYLVGTDAIHRLRRDLAGRPGFALRAFHDRLLAHGSVPVSLAAAAMRAEPAAPTP